MSCTHCESIQRRQQAVIDELGDDRYVGLYVDHDKDNPMTRRVLDERWGYDAPIDKALKTCRCDCHVPARIAGTLPRLVTS